MQRTVTYIALADMLFILFLALSGSFSGIIGGVLYYFAYIIPFAILFSSSRGAFSVKKFSPGRTAEYSALYLFPFLFAVILISFLTSELLGLFGVSSSVDVSGNIVISLLKNALLPAVFEELLFRLAPIALLSVYSKKSAVLISALFFALAHGNLFQIPYAFVAGFILGILYVVSGSIIPCILLHFANNTLSVFMQRNPDCAPLIYGTYITVAVGAAVSLIIIFLKKERYFAEIKHLFKDKTRLSFAPGAAIYVFLTLLLSVINFISLFPR